LVDWSLLVEFTFEAVSTVIADTVTDAVVFGIVSVAEEFQTPGAHCFELLRLLHERRFACPKKQKRAQEEILNPF
jgi:hypothetical protein